MWYSESKLKILYRSSSTDPPNPPNTPMSGFTEDLSLVTIDRIESIDVPNLLAAAKIIFHKDDPFHKYGLLNYIIFTYKEKWRLNQSGIQQVFEDGLNFPILFGRIHNFVENFLNGIMTGNFEYSPLQFPLDLVSAMLRINEEGNGELILFPSDNVYLFNQFVNLYNSDTWPNGKHKTTKIALFHVGQYTSPHTGQEIPKLLPPPIIERPQSGSSLNFSGKSISKMFSEHAPEIYTREGIGIFFGSNFYIKKEEFLRKLVLFPIVWEKEITNNFKIYTGYKMNFHTDIFPRTNESYKRLLKQWYFSTIKKRSIDEYRLRPAEDFDIHITINMNFVDDDNLKIFFEGVIQ